MRERPQRSQAKAGARVWNGGVRPLRLELAWPGLARLIAEEREWGRFPLWLPVAFGLGIALYFAAEQEPYAPAVAAIGLLCICLAARVRARPVAGILCAGLAALALGYGAATLRASLVAAPVLAQNVTTAVTGTVERVEVRARGYRLWLAVESFENKRVGVSPRKVRVTFSRRDGMPAAGDRIRVRAEWQPPLGPVMPGGYDWARDAYFQGIGAVGMAQDAPEIVRRTAEDSGFYVRNRLEHLRAHVAARIRNVLPNESGALAAALVVGDRAAIPGNVSEAMRVAGLAHILAISGLHMALFAGAVFAFVRLGLAMLPGIALRHSIKSWAAGAALLAGYFYLLLAGQQVATQRAFLMAGIAFVAMMIGRFAVTVRSVAIAAGVLLVLVPEMLLSISFQMSFAAVVALIAAYEVWRARRHDGETGHGLMARARFYVTSLGMTSVIAGGATAIIAAYHFQRIGTYSLPANLLAVPLVGMVIMPSALAALLLMPFGLDAPFWLLMGQGIDLVVLIARSIEALPGSEWGFAKPDVAGFVLMVLALIWFSLWRTDLRYAAAAPMLAGLFLAGAGERADIYVEPGGRAAAVRHPDGQFRITGIRFARFAAASWLAADGDPREISDAGVTQDVACDARGCVLKGPRHETVVLAWSYAALRSDCAQADVVITRLVAPPECRALATVIDANDLAQGGAAALYLRPEGIEVRHARLPRAERPWFNRPVVRSPGFREEGERPEHGISVSGEEPDTGDFGGGISGEVDAFQ